MQPDVLVLADIVATAIKTAQAPLLARIATLEALQSTKSAEVIVGPAGPAGRDADEESVKAAVLAHITPLVSDDVIEQVVAREVTKAMSTVRVPLDGVNGVDGKDADVEAVKRDILAELKPALCHDVVTLVGAEVTKAFEAIPIPKDGAPGRDGADADIDEIRGVVQAEVSKAFAAIPPAKDGADGRSVELSDVVPVIQVEVLKAFEAAPKPKDGEPGRSIELADVAPLIASEVSKSLEQWPRPKDGVSLTTEDVAPLISAEVTKAVSAWPVPKDGVGMAGVLVDRDGQLVATLSDGTVKQLGPVVGQNGRDVNMADVTKQIADAVAQFPRPKDGAPGRDGTLENLKVIREDERTIVFALKDGTPIEGGTIVLNHPVFQDLYSEKLKGAYRTGDMVQWDGSGWIALKDAPPGKPGGGRPEDTGWKLWIKHGNDGKAGSNGTNGKDGRDGKDRY